jgi:hypothetical protein
VRSAESSGPQVESRIQPWAKRYEDWLDDRIRHVIELLIKADTSQILTTAYRILLVVIAEIS